MRTDNDIVVHFNWPSKSDYRLMCLVKPKKGPSVMLSTFGTRSRPKVFETEHSGVLLDQSTRTITITPSTSATVVAPLLYRPPTARGNFVTHPPTADVYGWPTHTTEGLRDRTTYTWCPALLSCSSGEWRYYPLRHAYSEPGSERRPTIKRDRIEFETGVLNCYVLT